VNAKKSDESERKQERSETLALKPGWRGEQWYRGGKGTRQRGAYQRLCLKKPAIRIGHEGPLPSQETHDNAENECNREEVKDESCGEDNDADENEENVVLGLVCHVTVGVKHKHLPPDIVEVPGHRVLGINFRN